MNRRADVRSSVVFLEEVFSKAVEAVIVIVKERISAGLATLAFAIVKSISVTYVLHVLLKSLLTRLRRRRSIPKCLTPKDASRSDTNLSTS